MFSFFRPSRLSGGRAATGADRREVRCPALRLEALEDRTLLTGVPGLPDVTVLSTWLATPTTVQFAYQTQGDPGPFTVAVFRSADPTLDPGDLPVSNLQVIWPAPGDGIQVGTITLPAELPIDPVRKFVLVAADPLNVDPEVDRTNNVASFRTLSLGVVVPGFSLSGGQPAWVNQVASTLQGEGYDATIPVDWSQLSDLSVPGTAQLVGWYVAGLVRQYAATLAVRPNDVVDVNFIGHSRGAVVVDQALWQLAFNPGLPSLQLGYDRLTLLDPHPAGNQAPLNQALAELNNGSGVSTAGQFSFNQASSLSTFFAQEVLEFQAATQDPAIVVPPNAAEVDVFYQTLPWYKTLTEDHLLGVNLWGSLSAVSNPYLKPVFYGNIGIFEVGHTSVPDLYLAALNS